MMYRKRNVNEKQVRSVKTIYHRLRTYCCENKVWEDRWIYRPNEQDDNHKKPLYNHYRQSVTVLSWVLDDGKGGGKDSRSNRDEDVQDNMRSHNEGHIEKWKHQEGVRVDDINEMREIWMRWHRHVMRMEKANPGKKVLNNGDWMIDQEGDPGRDGKIALRRIRTTSKWEQIIQKTDICGGGNRRQLTLHTTGKPGIRTRGRELHVVSSPLNMIALHQCTCNVKHKLQPTCMYTQQKSSWTLIKV